MDRNKNNETPEVSIDEALELFIAITYPQGIPEDVDRDELFRTLKAKIAQDRPEWAAKNNDTNKKTAPPSATGNYSEIKEAIIAKSNEPEVPEDPEERYLYERKQKALKNLAAKKSEEKENAHREALRKKIIEKNRSKIVDEDFLNKTLQIKLELQKKLASIQKEPALHTEEKKIDKPEFSEAQNKASEVSFSDNDIKPSTSLISEFSNELPFDDGLNNKENSIGFIKDIEKLDRSERIKAMQEFNKARRTSMKTKEAVLRPRFSSRLNSEEDDRFSMGLDGKNETEKLERPKSEDNFLKYLIERRRKKSGDMESKLESAEKKEKNLFGSTAADEKRKTSRHKDRSMMMDMGRQRAKAINDMSMEGRKRQSGKLDIMSQAMRSSSLVLE